MERHVIDKSERFSSLHRGPELLVLANAWDAASALLIEQAGARAIATTSAGLAWAHGYSDGGALPRATLISAIQSILRVTSVPVSVDIEDGYSQDPATVAELVGQLHALGVVGINIEDGTAPPELLAAKIAQIRERLRHAPSFFINARTDVYLRGLAIAGSAAEVVRRAAIYPRAGASGLFVPMLAQPDDIHRVIDGLGTMSLNVMAVPGLPNREMLERLGVRRLSAGSAMAQSSLAFIGSQAKTFIETGRAAALFDSPSADYAELNARLAQLN
ncbi:isocitrate lyase/PEP mutase family protein [Peristeroidobacter agariperforans]|uniref:isocitrate lyase/PEP mutase family protein n=1 Tax=Peristeroidobacter agariperforans TaxID=268404 RepID=UPI00101BF8BF|nr:isocitrate lyase/phosphoenolpyruvate mutase family protein [Peristeroidobacter agariperforans]